MKQIFCERLREERKKLGLLQKEMAAKLNMPPNTYNGYETGKRLPDMEIISKIADILQVSVDYLLGRTDIRNPYNKTSDTSNHKKNKFSDINELSPESQKELEKYIELLKLKDKMSKSSDETSSALDTKGR